MTPFAKGVVWVSAIAVVGAAWLFASPPTSVPGRILRWIKGEPGAVQWVNDTAGTLRDSDLGERFERLAGSLLQEYETSAASLPAAPHSQGRLVPLARLPAEMRGLGGTYGDPELVLRLGDALEPVAVVVSWGHMRQAIVFLKDPNASAPEGFFVRRITSQLYVLAREG